MIFYGSQALGWRPWTCNSFTYVVCLCITFNHD